MMETQDTVIIGNVTMTIPMPPNGAQLVITQYIYNKDAENDVHRRVDGMRLVADRQLQCAAVSILQMQRKAQLGHLESVKARFAELGDTVKAGKKLPTAHKNEFDNGQQSINQILRNIAQIEEDLSEAQEKVKLTG